MSALGQKRTSAGRFAMAALPSKADVVGVHWAKRNCKPKCKPTDRHSMVLGMTYRDRERKIAERGCTLNYWAVQVGTRVLELENRKRPDGIDTITGTLSCRLGLVGLRSSSSCAVMRGRLGIRAAHLDQTWAQIERSPDLQIEGCNSVL